MEEGIILIDKPTGMTSFGVVARVRGFLTRKYGRKIKVGHTGTLDPFATGLMILVVGKECKNAEKYSKLDKVYEATIILGKTSSTSDPEGEIIDVAKDEPTSKEVEATLKKFVGKITQTPPIYSAIKIGGKRAYQLARKGQAIEMPKREVEIFSLDLIDYKYPELKIRTHVSSGTYIRSLAEDIGKSLETGAYCNQLRRVSISKWSVDGAESLEGFSRDFWVANL